MRTRTHNPEEAYRRNRKDIKKLIAWLQDTVKEHGRKFAKDKNCWGYVGELEHLRNCLKDIMETQAAATPEEIEEILSDNFEEL